MGLDYFGYLSNGLYVYLKQVKDLEDEKKPLALIIDIKESDLTYQGVYR